MKEATTKSKSQRDKILTWLRMRGAQGVLNTELNSLCMRFGARIYELRKAGHDIKTVRVDDTTFRFVLTEEQSQTDLTREILIEGINVDNRERPAHEYRNQTTLF